MYTTFVGTWSRLVCESKKKNTLAVYTLFSLEKTSLVNYLFFIIFYSTYIIPIALPRSDLTHFFCKLSMYY